MPPPNRAVAFVDAVTAQPHHLPTSPGPRHLMLLRKLCDEADASGDLIPDAVLAAIAVEHHCAVVSLDRDFARFTSVRHIRPPL
nr:TA system VapC family ribonuclease toxin [Mycobacterium canetti]